MFIYVSVELHTELMEIVRKKDKEREEREEKGRGRQGKGDRLRERGCWALKN